LCLVCQQLKKATKLRSVVGFWERVYSQHDSDQCLLVDESNLSNIITVVDLPRGRRSKRRKIARAIAKAKQSLRTEIKDKKELKNAIKRLRCQRGLRDSLKLSNRLAQPHLPVVKQAIKELGMPQDLAYLPYLESGYILKARSPVGARGLWQLMPATARQAGLKVNRSIDQRIDVHKSTQAALSELKKYHETTKSWGLALTSYVYGHNGVMRAIDTHKTNDYVYIRKNHETNIFRFSSKNYYPRFLAIRNVMQKFEKEQTREKLAASDTTNTQIEG